MSNIAITVDLINQLQPQEVVQNELVKQQFIRIYDTLWGEGTGLAAYERESIHFNRYLADNQNTAYGATRFSIFTAFIDLAVCGLSVESGVRALCYLQGKNVNVGKDSNGKAIYEPRIMLTVSGYGELVLRAQCGQIKYADNPVLVYEEDEFSFSDNNGHKSINYTCRLPHKSRNIVACFIRIVRADNSVDYSVMYEEDWTRLAAYSEKQNSYYDQEKRQRVSKGANALYKSNNGGIDTGFLMAKCIKHAFKTYPKVRIGKGTELQTEQETPEMKIDDFYGVQEETPQSAAPFGPTPDYSNGVQVGVATQEPAQTHQSQSQQPEDDGAF